MFAITLPDGRQLQMDGTRILRIRRVVSGELGTTRVDLVGARMQLVMEPPEHVAQMALPELPSLTSVRRPDGSPVWFNAKAVVGPVYVTPEERKGAGVIKSAVQIFAPKKQFTMDGPTEVAEIIRKAGGSAEPIPPEDTLLTTLSTWFRSILSQNDAPAPRVDDGPPGATLDQ